MQLSRVQVKLQGKHVEETEGEKEEEERTNTIVFKFFSPSFE